MNLQLNAIKDRIRGLTNRNKQIDIEIDNNTPEPRKEALKAEKEDNNNELRKQRTQRYEAQQISEDLDFIKKSYLYLRKLGLVKSQHQFSKEFLNKSQEYLSMIICENRKPSVNAVHNLYKNLSELYSLYEEFEQNETINRNLYYLIDNCQKLITKRVLSYL